MNLTNAISESLISGLYFGLPKEIVNYKAIKVHTANGIAGATHVGVNVLRINTDGIATPHAFTIEDILNLEWIAKDANNEVNNDAAQHSGIIVCTGEVLEQIVQLFEMQGYGVIDSFQEQQASNTVTIFCRSHLFSRVESGSPTPKYKLIYEEDTGTLTAEQINV
jgi:hypothetical protein